jgi:hypothetical protein
MATPAIAPASQLAVAAHLGAQAQFVQDEDKHLSSLALTAAVNGGNVGIGTATPGFPLTFPNTHGDKISLWGQSGNHFGFGIQGHLLQIHTDGGSSDIAFGSGASGSFSETMRIKGNGNLSVKGDITLGGSFKMNGALIMSGAITPSVGNAPDKGIQFPKDPGGGSGDEAFIRYFVNQGEATTLRIGINNDADDTLSFWQAGAERMSIGNGAVTVNSNLQVNGGLRVSIQPAPANANLRPVHIDLNTGMLHSAP